MTNKQPDLLFCGSPCQDCCCPYRRHRVILLHVVKYRTACDSGDQIKSERERAPGQGNVEMEAECLNRLLCEGGGGKRVMIVAGRLRR